VSCLTPSCEWLHCSRLTLKCSTQGEVRRAVDHDHPVKTADFVYQEGMGDRGYANAEISVMPLQRHCPPEPLSGLCHSGCLGMLSFRPSAGFMASIAWIQAADTSLLLRTRSYRLRKLGAGLRVSYPRLPGEICDIIAGYLYREWTALQCARRWLAHHSASVAFGEAARLSTAGDIFAEYLVIDGIRYLGHLSNDESRGRLVYRPRPEETCRELIATVSEDHLGIREVELLTSRGDRLRPDVSEPGVWWRTLCLPPSGGLDIRSNVRLSLLLSEAAC